MALVATSETTIRVELNATDLTQLLKANGVVLPNNVEIVTVEFIGGRVRITWRTK